MYLDSYQSRFVFFAGYPWLGLKGNLEETHGHLDIWMVRTTVSTFNRRFPQEKKPVTVAKMSLPEISFRDALRKNPVTCTDPSWEAFSSDCCETLRRCLHVDKFLALRAIGDGRGCPWCWNMSYCIIYCVKIIKDLYISAFSRTYSWWCYHDHRGFAQGIKKPGYLTGKRSIPNSPSLELGRKRTLPYSAVATTHPTKITNILYYIYNNDIYIYIYNDIYI